MEELRQFDEAITVYREAAAISSETRDRHGEAAALNNLGITLQALRRFDEAIAAHRHAAAIWRETRDWQGTNWALHNLEKAQARQQA